MLKNFAMDVEDFRIHGKEVVDYICKYLATVGDRSVIPSVCPGYLQDVLPEEAPEFPEKWTDIMNDMERLIMPGITHWQHPRFHAYFPAGNSYPSIMGDMISDALGCVGFSWAASPACTELEMIMLDWLAKIMKLPKCFLHCSNLGGGGVIQNSASDCILVTMLSARHQTIKLVKADIQKKTSFSEDKIRIVDGAILTKLVGYCSSLAHSSIEKAGMISFVNIRQLEVDDDYSLRGSTLESAIRKDLEKKLIPFFVCATLGTTGCCSFDNLREIGEICKKYKIWLHLDAAYAGSSFICPEFQHYLQGIENVDSMNFNPNKFMLVNFDCSILWIKQSALITESMNVDPVYLQHKHSRQSVDFRHWGVPLSRRFRSLKLWFVIRAYGVEGLRNYIRNHVYLASEFASLVRGNDSFEIVGQVVLGLVSFRLKASSRNLLFTKQELNSLNQYLARTINETGKIHLTPSVVKDKYILRFCVCSEHANLEDIKTAWKVIETVANEILQAQCGMKQWWYHMSRADVTNKDQIISVAERLVSNIISPPQCARHTPNNRKVQSHQPAMRNIALSNCSQMADNAILNMAGDIPNMFDFEEHVPNKDGDDSDPGVFICENDLGIGGNKGKLLSEMLKMVNYTSPYSPNFFKSLCFCNDLKNKSSQFQMNDCDSRRIASAKSHLSTFCMTDRRNVASKDDV